MEDFQDLTAWAQALVNALSPAGRMKLQRRFARDLRRSQAERIAQQKNPDGSAFAPRKQQAPRFRARRSTVRERAAAQKDGAPMFRKIRTAAHLRAGVDEEGAWVGFTGRTARIAQVHQDGAVDRAAPGGPRVRYARRELLGFTADELAAIERAVVEHVDV